MSEEAPMRDRSHIEKTLMLNEDKPVDDYSGNHRKDLGLGLGPGLGSEASGSPGLRALEMVGSLEEAHSAASKAWVEVLDWQGRRRGNPSRGNRARVEDKSQCCRLGPGASLHAVAGEAC